MNNDKQYGPELPPYFNHIVTDYKGSKTFYNVLNSYASEPTSKDKLIHLLNLNLDKKYLEQNL